MALSSTCVTLIQIQAQKQCRFIMCELVGVARPRGYKVFFILNTARHRIYPAHNCKNANKCWHFNIYSHDKNSKTCHSKIDKTDILMTHGSLMKAESIAECSIWIILLYVGLH